MDLGAVGLDGFVGSDSSGFAPSDPETTKHNKWYGSGFLKQERSSTTPDHSRTFKLSKTLNDDISASRAMLRSNANATLFPHEPQMLSFSSQKSEPLFLDNNNKALQYSHHTLSSYSRTISGNMQGMGRGAFTPSQWMELEHQALIYKYLTANLPVPPHLLIPIKKALESAAFCNALLRPNHPMGWGGFHLGLPSSTDPEPGRCRRTDGKKWRCSRDAVVDQKYCERHMNRGRHRSRKPVEGHNGHGTTTPTTTTTTSSKQLPNNNNNNTLSFAQLQPNNIMHPPLASDTSAAPNRMIMNNKENGSDTNALAMLPPTLELKPKENPFVIHKQQIPYEESSRNEFGLVTSDSLLNPSHKNATLLSNRTFSSSQTKQDTDSQRSLRQFIDDWPKTQSHQHRSWPELDMQSERTELSISIPMTCSDFMSSASSPTNEKVTLSPLRLSRELDPIQMGLGVGNGINESSNTSRQANWIPISWESSMGGPLGEVLNLSNNNNNNNTSENCAKNNSALNLLSDGWDNTPPLGSSPTGVLQKTVFGSLSNSSAGSSPRADNNSSSLPAL